MLGQHMKKHRVSDNNDDDGEYVDELRLRDNGRILGFPSPEFFWGCQVESMKSFIEKGLNISLDTGKKYVLNLPLLLFETKEEVFGEALSTPESEWMARPTYNNRFF
ncbi:hypothetical protein CEXT_488161 [Caerostris extrusa]|uniref:Uncharacterized protein n=1 Tax=Caerostris extrusa TaxID=172846 RepID=A0AAV4URL9_CAEEX|nr:hypothetical protein CEXT_488161 [Caerostris extrusa]